MKKILLIISLILSSKLSFAQDSGFARTIVDTLCSEYFWGRGYTNNGMQKAANFLQNKFKEFGVSPLNGKYYFQNYNYSVNSFPGKMELSINGKNLVPGVDFIVSPSAKKLKASGSLQRIINPKSPNDLIFRDENKSVTINLKKKLTWSVATEVEDYIGFDVLSSSVDSNILNYSCVVENELIKKFKTQNICGIVKGTRIPDSIIFITAHYDHLGGMGANTFFAGANDNASGVALLLNLARYYAKNPQPYSIGFILFSGEEAGLLGSKYFTENPLVDLKKIKFLMNTDLAGTGIDGITVCNATEYSKEFELIQQVNKEHNLLKAINPRGKAANSDHYWFSEKNIPCFFFYTLGGISAYHDVFDVASTLPLTEHEDLFKLVIEFNKKLMQ